MLKTQLSLNYIFREPKEIQKTNPLIILLHGYGSNEEDLFSFESELPNDSYIISARAPYSLQGQGNAWYEINFDADLNKFTNDEEAIQSRNLISKFIDELIITYPIDISNITLIGFSQGAILSYSIALTYPEKIKNVIALSGYFHPSIMPNNYLENKAIKKLNIFSSHGTVDQVIPIEWARETQKTFNSLNIEITYKEYPVGHGVAPQNFYDFLKWLLSK